MSARSQLLSSCVFVATAAVSAWAQTPLGTSFTYQGRLEQNGQPVNGLCDIQARLYAVPVGGAWIGLTQCADNVNVQDGLFTIQLDFGAPAFAGDARWLEFGVRKDTTLGNCAAGGFTPLTPRQPLTAAPYATYSAVAGFANVAESANRPWVSSGANVSLVGGNVGIGTATPELRLQVAGGTDAGPAGGGFAMFGTSSGLNIACDSNEIMARNNGATSTLYVNHNGGDVLFQAGGVPADSRVGIGTAGPLTSKLYVDGGASRALEITSAYSFASAVFRNTVGGPTAAFLGDVSVNGQLSKSGGSFRIDHPLDPANKYLYHSFVESPDMMNVYNGNVVTDERGYATIEMPDWFEALNREFRYQLTVLDDSDSAAFVQVKVVAKLKDNRFTIRSSAPRVEVSWQITGVRRDPWAEAHRIPIEQEKQGGARGRYQHPELYGQPPEMGIEQSQLSSPATQDPRTNP